MKRKKILSTIDDREIHHFSSHSDDWWNIHGTYAPLHKMTPARMAYIQQSLGKVAGLSILDIGCGGGLVSEPLTRMGATVTGVDADKNAIKIASDHATKQGLSISYIHGAAEDFLENDQKFDVVIALEIIEHVSDPSLFVQLCADLLKPNGKIIFSTLNRTWKSYGLAIVAAERILNWAPVGTHEWGKFIKPSELARLSERAGLTVEGVSGLIYRPLRGDFCLHPHDLDINYFMVAGA